MVDLSSYEKLPISFYKNPDVVTIARQLVGKFLFTNIGGKLTAGKIVETEAYNGRDDRACHAFQKRTPRTEVMYAEGGRAYVYLCYGIHHLFNIVTNKEGLADAVLVRAVEPVIGIDIMQDRRGEKVKSHKLTAGPGTLTQALGITRSFDKVSLLEDQIWVAESHDEEIQIGVDRRVGVDYAGEDAKLPWRFFIEGNEFVSVKKRNP